MLTSAVTYQNKYSYQSGDPFLVPQIHRATFFDAGWKWINFSLNYDHCWNMYTSYTRPYDDINHPGVLLFGRASIPHSNRYGNEIESRFIPVLGNAYGGCVRVEPVNTGGELRLPYADLWRKDDAASVSVGMRNACSAKENWRPAPNKVTPSGKPKEE